MLLQIKFISNIGKSSYFNYDYNYLIGDLDEINFSTESVSTSFTEQKSQFKNLKKRRFVSVDSPKRE